MTREKAIAKLEHEQTNRATESAHIIADDVLCKLLVSLGYEDVVKAYKGVPKWYA